MIILKKYFFIIPVICVLSFSIHASPINNSILNTDSSRSLSVADRLDEAVLNWASDKVQSAFSYNWVDYKEVTERSKLYFTAKGYAHYLNSLKDSGSTESVINQKLILQVKMNGVAKILKEGTYQDKYAWQVEVPVIFRYYGASDIIVRKAKIILLISRASKVDFENGLAITQLLLKPES